MLKFTLRNAFNLANLNLKPFFVSTRILSNKSDSVLKNEKILKFYQELVFIDGDGKNLGLMPVKEILAKKPNNSDLVIVDKKQTPPVSCFRSRSQEFRQVLSRIEAETRSRLANKSKEMHLSVACAIHDFNVKLRKVKEWIEKGWRVKIVIENRKNSKKHINATLVMQKCPKRDLMHRVLQQTASIAEITGIPEMEGEFLIFNLSANASTLSKVKQSRSLRKTETDPEDII